MYLDVHDTVPVQGHLLALATSLIHSFPVVGHFGLIEVPRWTLTSEPSFIRMYDNVCVYRQVHDTVPVQGHLLASETLFVHAFIPSRRTLWSHRSARSTEPTTRRRALRLGMQPNMA